MASHGKKYDAAAKQVDRNVFLGTAEAVSLVKSLSSAKFDETIELAVRLGVDPRKAEQIVRGTLSLPAGTGKTNRVVVFAAGDAAAAARAAGADEVGADDLVAKVAGGFLDFDLGPCAWTTWSHAKPKDRHRHHGRREGRSRLQGRHD